MSPTAFVDEVCYTLDEASPMHDNSKMLLNDLLKLFHKIMCHHECYQFLESVKLQKKCTAGKAKSLRVKLADKKTL